MNRVQSEEQKRAAFGTAAQEMHQRLSAWRQSHPEATFDEIAAQVSQERRQLMGGLLGELAQPVAEVLVETTCEACGTRLQNKGLKQRGVLHGEGTVRLERTYYYCPGCRRGFFPPGPVAGTR